MKNLIRKSVYESIDILSQEMAKQNFKDNREELAKEVEKEIETAKSRKEQKEIEDYNLDTMLKTNRNENENEKEKENTNSSHNNQKEKSIKKKIEAKINKSNRKVNFHKDLKNHSPNLEKINFSETYKNININNELNNSQKNLGKFISEKNSINNKNNLNKSFVKKTSQINLKTNSYPKSLKDENSSIKTSLVNSDFGNKINKKWENSNQKKNKLFEKKDKEKKDEIAINNTFKTLYSKINLLNKNSNDDSKKENNIDKGNSKIIINDYNENIKKNKTNSINDNDKISENKKNSLNKLNDYSNIKNNNNINNKDNGSNIISNNNENKNKSNIDNQSIINSNKSLNKIDNNKSNNKTYSGEDTSNNMSKSDSSDSSKSFNLSENNNNYAFSNENSKSNTIIKESSKEEQNSKLSNLKSERNIKNIQSSEKNYVSDETNSRNIPISSFSSSFSKSQISLQKIPLKNYTIYRKKNRTPKEFYEHQLYLMEIRKKMNNKKKLQMIAKEEQNYTYSPEINPISEQIINEKGNYIPLFKRAVELQNQKKLKKILNKRKKEKEISDMMRTNNSFYVNQELINEFYSTQIDWKDKIKKRNRELYLKKEEEKIKEENKIKNYKLEIDEKSKKIIEKKLRKYNITNDTNNSFLKKNNKDKNWNKNENIYNIYERLYKDAQSHEKKISNLKQSYFNTLFKPNINNSFDNNTKLFKKEIEKRKKLYIRNDKMKINNTTKINKKKNFSITFEEINMPIIYDNKISRNTKLNNINNNIGSTKSTLASNNVRNMNNIGSNSANNKFISTTHKKEINPFHIKLGEIKEMDSLNCESSDKNKNKEKNVDTNKNSKLSDTHGSFATNKKRKSTFDSNYEKESKKNSSKSIRRKSSSFIPSKFGKRENKDEKKEKQKNSIEKFNNIKNINNENSTFKRNNKKRRYSVNIVTNSKKWNQNKDKINQRLIKRNSVQSFNNKKNKLNKEKNIKNKINENNKNNKQIPNKLNLFENLINKNINYNDFLKNDNNIVFENSLLNDNGSFGKNQPSNILDNLSGQLKEKNKENSINKNNINAEKENKEDENNNKDEENIEESSSSSTDRKKKKKFKFNVYEKNEKKLNNFEDNTYSFDDISSLNEGDEGWIKKIGMLEMKRFKERKEKEKKNIDKNENNKEDKNNNNNLNIYKLNLREETSNSIIKPFTVADKKGIFIEFFKKK